MTTSPSNIARNIRSAEAANLLTKLGTGHQDAARLLSDASTPLGQAYAEAFSDNAAAQVTELRKHDPLPEPDRTPGAPHPDPFLAARGWHVNQHGIYTRRAEQQPQPPAEPDREAGS